MKKIYLSLLCICGIVIHCKAQSFEISLQAGSGISRYSGAGTVNSTFLNTNEQGHTGYPNNDGNRNYAIFNANVQFQYTFRSEVLIGLQTGYDMLGSKVGIDHIYTTSGEVTATGSFTDHLNYFNINPYIGYRLLLHKVRLDIMPGLDFAIGAGGREKGKATTADNVVYTQSNEHFGKPDDDVRAKIGLAAYYKKFGFSASYAHGIIDFNAGALSDGPVPSLHLNVARLGLSYQIK